jgi:hypothetical protein
VQKVTGLLRERPESSKFHNPVLVYLQEKQIDGTLRGIYVCVRKTCIYIEIGPGRGCCPAKWILNRKKTINKP